MSSFVYKSVCLFLRCSRCDLSEKEEKAARTDLLVLHHRSSREDEEPSFGFNFRCFSSAFVGGFLSDTNHVLLLPLNQCEKMTAKAVFLFECLSFSNKKIINNVNRILNQSEICFSSSSRTQRIRSAFDSDLQQRLELHDEQTTMKLHTSDDHADSCENECSAATTDLLLVSMSYRI